MTAILDLLLSRPLGWIINICYQLVGSYGLAIILFTLITKILLLPLAIKQQKSSAAMLRMRPKEEQIRKKYANNKDKLNEEIMKLYQEEHYNPMTSGCLPMLIQLPILYALYRPSAGGDSMEDTPIELCRFEGCVFGTPTPVVNPSAVAPMTWSQQIGYRFVVWQDSTFLGKAVSKAANLRSFHVTSSN